MGFSGEEWENVEGTTNEVGKRVLLRDSKKREKGGKKGRVLVTASDAAFLYVARAVPCSHCTASLACLQVKQAA